MKIKRYSNEELQKILTDNFYEVMISTVGDNENFTYVDELHDEYVEKLELYNLRIRQFHEFLQKEDLEPVVRKSVLLQLDFLNQGKEYIENANMEYQKKLYKEIKTTNFTRTLIRFPLDKKINSYYDDFHCEVVFYDDVCTLKGKFNVYKSLETKEERLNFVKNNTEITHIGMSWLPGNSLKAIIEVKGELNYNDPRIHDSGTTLLTRKFSDFDTLTLKDTSEIKNNDLRQFMQTKIDLDKENLTLKSKQILRGDEYSIYEEPDGEDLFIRYICRGTGRIYYNRLNLNNLELSSEFKNGDYDSYARAWWNLNTLGGNVEGKPVIRS